MLVSQPAIVTFSQPASKTQVQSLARVGQHFGKLEIRIVMTREQNK